MTLPADASAMRPPNSSASPVIPRIATGISPPIIAFSACTRPRISFSEYVCSAARCTTVRPEWPMPMGSMSNSESTYQLDHANPTTPAPNSEKKPISSRPLR